MISKILHSRTSRPVVGVFTCPNTSLVSPGSTPNFNLRLVGYLFLFTYLQASCRSLHCPNTSLVSPGLAPNLSLSRYSQCSSPGKLSEFSLVQTPHLCLQDLLPTSACRDILKHFTKKHVVSGNQLTSHISQMTLQPTCPKWK